MAAFPKISSGTVAKYPVTRRVNTRVMVYTFVDFSEQRFRKGVNLAEFDLVYNNIKTADKNTIQDFFNDRQGALDTTWTLTIEDPPGGPFITYDNMQFVPNQMLTASNFAPDRWKVTLKVRQTNPLT